MSVCVCMLDGKSLCFHGDVNGVSRSNTVSQGSTLAFENLFMILVSKDKLPNKNYPNYF